MAECLNTRCTTITRRDRLHVRATPRMLMPRARCSHFITQTSAFIIYQVSQSGLSAATAPAGLQTHKHRRTHAHVMSLQRPPVGIITFLVFFLFVFFSLFHEESNISEFSHGSQAKKGATRCVNLISVAQKSHVRIHRWRHEAPACRRRNFKTRRL